MSRQARYCPHCGGVTERLYSIETAALILDCSVETVRSWVKNRTIGSVKVGRLRRIPAHDLDKMIQRFPSLEEVAEGALF